MTHVVDLHAQKCRDVFTARVAADREGHRGDVVPRDYDAYTMASAMAADYPAVADLTVPTVETK